MSEWTRLAQPIRCAVELDKPLVVRREKWTLVQGDNEANAIVAEVYQTEGKPFDLAGYTVTLTFVRPDRLAVPPISAEVNGNIAIATLDEACYRVSGVYAASMQISKDGPERTILRLQGDVISSENDGTVTDEQILPTPEELLVTLQQVEQARNNANNAATAAGNAASNANSAASRATTAAGNAEKAAEDASDAAERANSAAENIENGTAPNALKLGGKPPEAYAAVDLLDNSRFEIAQAGYGGLHGNTKYAADRWTLSGGTAVWNGSNIVISSEVDGQQVNMVQKLADGTYKKGTVYTFAVMLADGTLGIVHGDFITNAYANIYDKEGKRVALGIQSDNVVIPVYTTGAHHIAWAALYEGAYTADSLPVYVPKGYAAELAECQRYYENSWFGAAKTDLFQMIGSCWNGSHFDVPVEFKQQKRTKPSMNYYPSGSRTTIQGFINSAYRDVTILDPEYRMGLRGVYVRVRVAEADLTIGYTYQLHAHWEACADL